jgi:hypothetical protein
MAAVVAIATFTAASISGRFGSMHVQAHATGAGARLPLVPGVQVTPLGGSDLTLSGDRAVAAALSRFHMAGDLIDPAIGLTRGLVTMAADQQYHNLPCWIVTLDVDVADPGGTGRRFRTLSVAINGQTGRYEFGWLGRPYTP